MKLFKNSQGFIIAFGFDMNKRVENPRMISWNDPGTNDWDPKSINQAGWVMMSCTIDPEFVREYKGNVIAYQPGKCIEMTFVGGPTVWRFMTLQSDMALSEVA
jgi:hypothetical protein